MSSADLRFDLFKKTEIFIISEIYN